MRVSINFIVAFIALLATACAGDIKIPTPQVTVPLPPELVAAVAVAVAGNNHDDESRLPEVVVPEEHPAASAEDWVHLVCTESCVVTYTSPTTGKPWAWFSPDGEGFEPLDHFEFAGDITFPAFDGWDLKIKAKINSKIPEDTHIETSQRNVLQYEAIYDDGGTVKKTTPYMDIPNTGENGYLSLKVLRLLGGGQTE